MDQAKVDEIEKKKWEHMDDQALQKSIDDGYKLMVHKEAMIAAESIGKGFAGIKMTLLLAPELVEAVELFMKLAGAWAEMNYEKQRRARVALKQMVGVMTERKDN